MDTVVYQNDHSKVWLDFSENVSKEKINIEMNDEFVLIFLFKDSLYLNSSFSKLIAEKIIVDDFEKINDDIKKYVTEKLYLNSGNIHTIKTLKKLSSGIDFLSQNAYIKLIELDKAPRSNNFYSFNIKDNLYNITKEIDDPLTLVAVQEVKNYYEQNE